MPAILGGIHRIGGAAKVWFAHNHPGGEARQSGADIKLTDMLIETLRGTGVEPQGMIVVAPGGDASFYDGLTNPKIKPTAAPRRLEVPITGRRFSGRAAHQLAPIDMRSEEHTSELQSLMRTSYAVFCLKKKKQ